MSWSDIRNATCPVAQSLAVIGDRWTMLIMRELFLGTRRFADIELRTGMSPPLLAGRLKRLEADGIVRRKPYSERPLRHEYRLTEKGLDLYPVLLGLKAWGEKWAPGVASFPVVHAGCGHETGLALTCTACGERFGPRDTRAGVPRAVPTESSGSPLTRSSGT